MSDIFVSLQNYTTYSVYSGFGSPDQWAESAVEKGLTALAITDKQNLIGAIEFQKACKKRDIKPLIGEEFVLVSSISGGQETTSGTIILYAKNEQGWKHLVDLNNVSNRRTPGRYKRAGFYFRPRIDIKTIELMADHLICVAPVEQSIGATFVGGRTGRWEWDNSSEAIFSMLSRLFGDDFYVGFNPRLNGSGAPFEPINDMHRQLRFKKVYTFNCHSFSEDYNYLYPVLRKLAGKNAMCAEREVYQHHLPDSDEKLKVPKAFHAQVIENMEELVDKCDFEIPTGVYNMPKIFLRPDNETGKVEEDIIAMIGEGFKRKIHSKVKFKKLRSFDELEPYADEYPSEHLKRGESTDLLKPVRFYIDQLKYEFQVIKDLGFLDYFHTVKDFCDFVDQLGQHNRGLARGSAAGALFSYLLHIVRIDPARHDLFFERFLNPDRQEIPDIDLDFSTAARDALKDYIREKYGKDSLVSIGTTKRLKVVSAIKALARIYGNGLPDNDGNIVTYNDWTLRGIISNKHVTQTKRGRDELDEYLAEYEDFKEFYDLHSDWIEKFVMPLQETVDGFSIHASGSLIVPGHIDDHLPIREDNRGNIITHFSHKDCELAGYPKFDLLVVDVFDIVAYTAKLVKKRHQVDIPEWEDIPIDDKQALNVYNTDPEGLFQFKTASFRKLLKTMKIRRFEDTVALVALNRPGPISAGAPDEFAAIRNGKQQPYYVLPELEPILKETVGLIVYQEQMMRTAVALSGFDGKEADHLRKATGKKLPQEMAKWEERFVMGGVERGHDESIMRDIWNQIVGFADYSFNKAHAVSYAGNAWYQAYIKARYPLEFYCGVLNSAKTDGKDNSVTSIKKKAEARGIEFVLPTMDAFATDFEPYGDNKIFWPMWALKGIGEKALDNLRSLQVNSFSSIDEMLESLDSKVWTKKVFETLIKADFFKSLGRPWEVMPMYYEARAKKMKKKVVEDVPFEYSHENEFKWILAKNEAYDTQVESWKKLAPFDDEVSTFKGNSLRKIPDGQYVFVGGRVTSLYSRQTVNGDWYARMIVEDIDERYIVMLWNGFWDREILDKQGRRPMVGDIVQVVGEKTTFKEMPQIGLNTPEDEVDIVWRLEEW